MDLSELENLFGDRLVTSESVRSQHSHDESWHIPENLPDAVIFPETSNEVSRIISFAFKNNIPVIPFGTGTALEGHVHAVNGGITIDSRNMNKVIQVNMEDMDCRVQAGVTREELNSFLRDTGLFFPVDPGANASIGGMCSTGASGTNTVKYGTIREQVIGLEVIMPDGKIIQTGSRARKSSAGYDLTHLMLGSEGTLGFISEISLRLHGRPEAISAGVCSFSELDGAVNTVIEAIQIGLPLSRIELLDELQIKAINQYKKTSHEEKPTLFIEIHGTPLGVREQIEKFEEISKEKNFLQLERLRNTIDLIHAIQSADSIMKLLSYYPTFKKDQMFSQIKRRISDCWERIMNSIIHQPEEDFLNEIINNLQIGRKNQNHIN
mgnify:CR=1 FL=1